MFNLVYLLFEYSAHDKYTLQITLASSVNAEHLRCFKFISWIFGLAIFNRRFLDIHFIYSFYKMMLKKNIELSDVEGVDAELQRGMKWTWENDTTDIIEGTLFLQEEVFGELVTTELKPDGVDIPVTAENKQEFVE